MIQKQPVREVIDLTDSNRNLLFNMSVEEARSAVESGDPAEVAKIDGHFAVVARRDQLVRMARSLAVPLRYFIAKRTEGPALVAANRIDVIRDFLQREGMGDQFHPSYTRMVPAHYVTEVALLGCPDPNPGYTRFFVPERNTLPADVADIGKAYIGATAKQVHRWIDAIGEDQPIGVSFSGGIDSGAVFLLTYHALLASGRNPARLKAFTLALDGGGEDLAQARRFLETLDLSVFHEPIEASSDALDLDQAVSLMEDYQPLDIQAGAMANALLHGIRQRYPDWKYITDGDGGDENLKDYPIEENAELTIKSVLNNPLLYHEGWGVESIKHSLTYTGGLSRGCTRTFAPAVSLGFDTFSPFMLPSVIAVSEGIPFIELTDWDHGKLYALKGRIVSAGIRSVTGMDMPVFEKRRFQHGAVKRDRLVDVLPDAKEEYRRAFQNVFHA